MEKYYYKQCKKQNLNILNVVKGVGKHDLKCFFGQT